jgi:hypothetical protein
MRVLTRTLTLIGLMLVTTVAEAAPAPLTPLVAEWDRYFSVQVQPTTAVGVVWNTSDWGTRRIQLLVEGLDAGGQTVSQQVVWLGVDLPAGSHAYFDTAMPPASSYRVRVFAFILDTTAGPR